MNSGTIKQSYETGITADYYGGGLIYENSGTITQSYVGGPVQAYILLGGIAVYNSGTIGSNVFWNINATGVNQAIADDTPAAAIGLSAAQMVQAPNFGPSWDVSATGVWALPRGATQPVLHWQLAQ